MHLNKTQFLSLTRVLQLPKANHTHRIQDPYKSLASVCLPFTLPYSLHVAPTVAENALKTKQCQEAESRR